MAASFGTETQNQSAQRMYNARASNYKESWHPDYSRRFISLVPIRAGDRVLDLCCGTGLEALLAADLVGENGEVVGVDVSSGMLEQLRERQRREPELGGRIRVVHHDVSDLETVVGADKGSFDVVLCSCAFVLFEDPVGVVAHWKEYLRSGGVMAIDIHTNVTCDQDWCWSVLRGRWGTVSLQTARGLDRSCRARSFWNRREWR